MRDGRTVDTHSDVIFDILQVDDGVRSFFIHQKGSKIDIAIVVPSRGDLERIESRFFHEVAREFPDLDRSKIAFSYLDREPYTVAGKRQYLLRE
jgi:hypothetical protein